VCITTYQPGTKSNPNPNPNPSSTTKQDAIVNIQLNLSGYVGHVTTCIQINSYKACRCTVCTTLGCHLSHCHWQASQNTGQLGTAILSRYCSVSVGSV